MLMDILQQILGTLVLILLVLVTLTGITTVGVALLLLGMFRKQSTSSAPRYLAPIVRKPNE